MKKLVGRTDMEDSLKRLDKLTQEEVRMATAQVLKVTHTIDEGVRGVVDKVVGVDGRVASVNDRVASVDRRVEGVDGRVASVDNKIDVVIEGARFIFSQPLDRLFNPYLSDGKEARVVMQRTANEVDQMKRWWSSNNVDIIRAGSTVLCREPITTGPSKMAFSTRSLDESQHCV